MARWEELLQRLSGGADLPSYRFTAPASQPALAELEASLGVSLPEQLRDLLQETDGIEQGNGPLIWSVERIGAVNQHFRADEDLADLYMPFDQLLFFADAGNGDQFAFPIIGGEARADVFAWDHENDSRSWVAPSLDLLLEWWLTGRISL